MQARRSLEKKARRQQAKQEMTKIVAMKQEISKVKALVAVAWATFKRLTKFRCDPEKYERAQTNSNRPTSTQIARATTEHS